MLGCLEGLADRSSLEQQRVKCLRELDCGVVEDKAFLLNTNHVPCSTPLKNPAYVLGVAGGDEYDVDLVVGRLHQKTQLLGADKLPSAE